MSKQLPVVDPSRVFRIKTSQHPVLWFRQQFRKRHINVPSKAADLLTRYAAMFNRLPEDITLAEVSLSRLGLFTGDCYGQILHQGVGRTVAWGGNRYVLSLATPSDALWFRIAYDKDQPREEWLRMAMDGLEHPMGNQMIFRIVHGRDRVRYFDADDAGDPNTSCDNNVQFIWRLIPFGDYRGRRTS